MSSVPGLFAAGECAAGLHGANRLGGNSLSDLLVFGMRAGEHAARFAGDHTGGQVLEDQVAAAVAEALAPIDGQHARDENPYKLQADLQDVMQDGVGIVRSEDEMQEALRRVERLSRRAASVGVPGNREYNNGWHTALDLANLLTVSEAIARSALGRRESRGAQFREDYPDKDAELGKVNTVVSRGPDGEMLVRFDPVPKLSEEQREVIEEHR